jgi:hypothetical protein
MKLKIKFRKEIHFAPPCRQVISPWTRLWFGPQLSMRALALAAISKPCKNNFN